MMGTGMRTNMRVKEASSTRMGTATLDSGFKASRMEKVYFTTQRAAATKAIGVRASITETGEFSARMAM